MNGAYNVLKNSDVTRKFYMRVNARLLDGGGLRRCLVADS